MANAPINVTVKLSADTKQFQAQMAALKATLEDLGKNQNIKIASFDPAISQSIDKVTKSVQGATKATKEHVQVQNLLHDIYNKNSGSASTKYLSSLKGLKDAYTRINSEASNTLVSIKGVATTLDSQAAASERTRIKGDLLAKTFDNMGQKMQNSGRQAQQLGRQLTTSLTLPILGASAAATKLGLDFTKANLSLKEGLIGRGKDVKDLSGAIDELNKQGSALSESFGVFSRTDITKVQTDFSKLTSNVKQLKDLTEASVKFGAVEGFTDLGTTTKLVGLLFTQFNGDMQKVNKTLSEFDTVANHTNIPIDQLVESLPKAMGMFKQMNVDVGQGSLILSAFTQSGQDAGQASQTLGRILAVMPAITAGFGGNNIKESKNKELRAFIDNWNSLNPDKAITFFDKTNKALNGATQIASLSRALAAMDDATRRTFSSTAFGKFQDQKAIQGLVDYGNALDHNADGTKQLLDAQQALAKDDSVDVFSQKVAAFLGDPSTEFAGAVQKLKNSATDLGKSLVPIATRLIDYLNKVADAFKNLSPGAKSFLGFLALSLAALGPLNTALGTSKMLIGGLLKGSSKAIALAFRPTFGSGGPAGGQIVNGMPLLGGGPAGPGSAMKHMIDNLFKTPEEKALQLAAAETQTTASTEALGAAMKTVAEETVLAGGKGKLNPAALAADEKEAKTLRARVKQLETGGGPGITRDAMLSELGIIGRHRNAILREQFAQAGGEGNPNSSIGRQAEALLQKIFGLGAGADLTQAKASTEYNNRLGTALGMAKASVANDPAVDNLKKELEGQRGLKRDIISFYETMMPTKYVKPEKIKEFKSLTDDYVKGIYSSIEQVSGGKVGKGNLEAKQALDNYIATHIKPVLDEFSAASLGERIIMMNSGEIKGATSGLDPFIRTLGLNSKTKSAWLAKYAGVAAGAAPSHGDMFGDAVGFQKIKQTNFKPFFTSEIRTGYEKFVQDASRQKLDEIVAAYEAENPSEAKAISKKLLQTKKAILARYEKELANGATEEQAMFNAVAGLRSNKNVAPYNSILKPKYQTVKDELGKDKLIRTGGAGSVAELESLLSLKNAPETLKYATGRKMAGNQTRENTTTAFRQLISKFMGFEGNVNDNPLFEKNVIHGGRDILAKNNEGFSGKVMGNLLSRGGLNKNVEKIAKGTSEEITKTLDLPQDFWDMVSLRLWGGMSPEVIEKRIKAKLGDGAKDSRKVMVAVDKVASMYAGDSMPNISKIGINQLINPSSNLLGHEATGAFTPGSAKETVKRTLEEQKKKVEAAIGRAKTDQSIHRDNLRQIESKYRELDASLDTVEEEKRVLDSKVSSSKKAAAKLNAQLDRARATQNKHQTFQPVSIQKAQQTYEEAYASTGYDRSWKIAAASKELKAAKEEYDSTARINNLKRDAEKIEKLRAEIEQHENVLRDAHTVQFVQQRKQSIGVQMTSLEKSMAEQKALEGAAQEAQQKGEAELKSIGRQSFGANRASTKGKRTDLTVLRAAMKNEANPLLAFRTAREELDQNMLNALEEITINQVTDEQGASDILAKHGKSGKSLNKLARDFSVLIRKDTAAFRNIFDVDVASMLDEAAISQQMTTNYSSTAANAEPTRRRLWSKLGRSTGGKQYRESDVEKEVIGDAAQSAKLDTWIKSSIKESDTEIQKLMKELDTAILNRNTKYSGALSKKLKELVTADNMLHQAAAYDTAKGSTDDIMAKRMVTENNMIGYKYQQRLKAVEDRIAAAKKLETDLVAALGSSNYEEIKNRIERDFEKFGEMSNQDILSRSILHSNDIESGRGYQYHSAQEVGSVHETATQLGHGAGFTDETLAEKSSSINTAKAVTTDAAKAAETEAEAPATQGIFRRAFNKIFRKAAPAAADDVTGGAEKAAPGMLAGLAGPLAPILPEIGIALAAIAALVGAFLLIRANWDSVSKGIGDGIEKLKKAFSELWHNISDPISEALHNLGFLGSGGSAGKDITNFWKNIGTVINGAFTVMSFVVKAWAGIAKPVFKVVGDAIQIIAHTIEFVVALISGDWTTALEQLKGVGETVWNAYVDGMLVIPRVGALVFSKLSDIALGALQSIAQAAADWTSWMPIGGVSDLAQKAADGIGAVKDKIHNLPDSLTNWGDAIKFNLNNKGQEAAKKAADDGQKTLDNNPLDIPIALDDAQAQDAQQQLQDLISSLQSELQKMEQGWKQVAMKGFDDYVKAKKKALTDDQKAATDSIDNQIKAIDDLIKAEEDQAKQEQYLDDLKKVRQDRMFNNNEYTHSRGQALYEGNYDQAAMLDLQHAQDQEGFTTQELDIQKKHDEEMRKEALQAWKDALQDQKTALEQQQQQEQQALDDQTNVLKDNLERQIDAIIQYAPRTAAEAANMQQQILDTLGGYTGDYNDLAVSQSEAWHKTWASAFDDAKKDVADKAFWAGAGAMQAFAYALGIDPSTLTPSSNTMQGVDGGTSNDRSNTNSGVSGGTSSASGPTTGGGSPRTFSHTGGPIGALDTGPTNVPATLQSGEFVIQRNAVKALGPKLLTKLNNAHQMPMFHEGGPVGALSSGISQAYSNIFDQAVKGLEAGTNSLGPFTKENISDNLLSRVGGFGGQLASTIINAAMQWLGVPYLWGGTDPSIGLDCSGLILRAFEAAGIGMPRTSEQQAQVGSEVTDGGQPADLVYYGHPANHIGLYTGGGKMIEAPHTGDVVKIASVGAYTGMRRVLQESNIGGFGSGSSQSKAIQGLADWGWGPDQWNSLNALVSHESGWRADAKNPNSEAAGLFQFLKPAWQGYITNAGGPAYWSTDDTWQIKGGLDYIKSRYGSPDEAWNFWQSRVPIGGKDVGNWYHKGGLTFDVPHLDTGGSILKDGIAMVHKNERVLSASEASNIGGDIKMEFHFEGGYFGTDAELNKLAAKIEKDILPKINRAYGDQNRFVSRSGK